MLLTLLLWVYVSIISFLAGHALVSIGRRLTGTMPVLAAPVVCLLGVAGLTAVLGWAWLLVPINLTTHTLGAGLAGCLWNLAATEVPLAISSLAPILARLVSRQHLRHGYLGAQCAASRLVDTGGYHAPMIEWIHQYAIVPGLANLNYRFGFNNSWFLFSALFRFQLAPAVPWHGLNGWLMMMMGWFSLTEWHRYQTSQQPFSAWLGGWFRLWVSPYLSLDTVISLARFADAYIRDTWLLGVAPTGRIRSEATQPWLGLVIAGGLFVGSDDQVKFNCGAVITRNRCWSNAGSAQLAQPVPVWSNNTGFYRVLVGGQCCFEWLPRLPLA